MEVLRREAVKARTEVVADRAEPVLRAFLARARSTPGAVPAWLAARLEDALEKGDLDAARRILDDGDLAPAGWLWAEVAG